MSKSVFISHSSKDKELAEAIVELIQHGIGLPENEIFCSSVEGYGIPSGEDFLLYIKEQMEAPKMVILLLTPSYWKSQFCLCEMGGAWFKSHRIFPITVSAVNNNDLQAVLLTTQAFQINNDLKYNDIRKLLFDELIFEKKTDTQWDIQRRKFLNKIAKLCKNLAIPEEISIEQFLSLQSQFEESQAELNKYQQENQTLHTYIQKLESLKNTDEVNTIKQELKITITGTSEQFEAQFEQIKKQLQEITSEKEVSICILSNYYKQSYKAGHIAIGRGFTEAERNGYIQVDFHESGGIRGGWHEIKVFWNTKEMTLLKQQLKELDTFLGEGENIGELQSYTLDHYEIELEPQMPRFWKEVYNL